MSEADKHGALRLADLAGLRVAVWGYGREGRAAVTALRRRFPDKALTLFCSEAEAADLKFERRADTPSPPTASPSGERDGVRGRRANTSASQQTDARPPHPTLSPIKSDGGEGLSIVTRTPDAGMLRDDQCLTQRG